MTNTQSHSESSVGVVVQKEELLSTMAVSKLTGISTRNILRRVQKGLFPAGTRVGRVWKWKRSEIEKWMAEHPPGSQSAPTPPKPAKSKPAKSKKVKKTKPPVVVVESIPEAVLHPIPAAVLAAVENVAPVGADFVSAEVGGAA